MVLVGMLLVLVLLLFWLAVKDDLAGWGGTY